MHFYSFLKKLNLTNIIFVYFVEIVENKVDVNTHKKYTHCALTYYYTKKYFIIDPQFARHFVHYSECLYHPPSPSMQFN